MERFRAKPKYGERLSKDGDAQNGDDVTEGRAAIEEMRSPSRVNSVQRLVFSDVIVVRPSTGGTHSHPLYRGA